MHTKYVYLIEKMRTFPYNTGTKAGFCANFGIKACTFLYHTNCDQ